MLNGRKNAVLGLSALLTLILLELMAVAVGVAVILELVLGVDVPFIGTSEG